MRQASLDSVAEVSTQCSSELVQVKKDLAAASNTINATSTKLAATSKDFFEVKKDFASQLAAVRPISNHHILPGFVCI